MFWEITAGIDTSRKLHHNMNDFRIGHLILDNLIFCLLLMSFQFLLAEAEKSPHKSSSLYNCYPVKIDRVCFRRSVYSSTKSADFHLLAQSPPPPPPPLAANTVVAFKGCWSDVELCVLPTLARSLTRSSAALDYAEL